MTLLDVKKNKESVVITWLLKKLLIHSLKVKEKFFEVWFVWLGWFNPSWQLSTTQTLSSLPHLRDQGENCKSESKKTFWIEIITV